MQKQPGGSNILNMSETWTQPLPLNNHTARAQWAPIYDNPGVLLGGYYVLIHVYNYTV